VFLHSSLGNHEAGQHVDVRLTAPDGYRAQPSYSIASAHGAPSLELAIECLDDGEVSPYFHDIARPGDSVEIRGPIGGHFIWRVEDGGPVLLIAGGSGVVPLVAIARHRAALAPATEALLVYSARSWDEMAFRDEMLGIEARDPDFSFVGITTRGPRHRPGDYDRRLDPPLLHDVLTRWGRVPRSIYVCGSNAFVEAATTSLLLDSVPPGGIRTERFGGSAS
jgi:ferredoxin-NADP reductase